MYINNLNFYFINTNLNATEIYNAINTILCLSNSLKFDQRTILANLAEYRTRKGLFGLSNIIESVVYCFPDEWWKVLATNELLSTVTLKLFSLHCTSASYERNWSVYFW